MLPRLEVVVMMVVVVMVMMPPRMMVVVVVMTNADHDLGHFRRRCRSQPRIIGV